MLFDSKGGTEADGNGGVIAIRADSAATDCNRASCLLCLIDEGASASFAFGDLGGMSTATATWDEGDGMNEEE